MDQLREVTPEQGSEVNSDVSEAKAVSCPSWKVKAPAAVALMAGLTACGGGGESGTAPTPSPPSGGPPPSSPPPSSPPPGSPPPAGGPPPGINPSPYQFKTATNDDEAAAFLQQAQFSSTKSEIAAVRATDFSTWLDRQLQAPASETIWDWLDRRGYYNVDETTRTAPFSPNFFNSTYGFDYGLWRKLFTASDAVRQRLALALSEFFVISVGQANPSWSNFFYAHWWDTLSANVNGNFRSLLETVTLHPVMGNFLNTKGNKKENSSGRVPDENYAREVMQLFSIGLYRLNLDGSIVTDSSGRPVESYTQEDVTNLARVFTGYDFDTSDGVRYTITRTDGTTTTVPSREYCRKPMRFNAAEHSTLAKNFLGASIPAGTPGRQSLTVAMDTLFNHPNVGPFFAKQMIQRLVTSNPSPGYVRRVAEAFNNNGQGVRGDLNAVWRAILLDDEARNPANRNSTTFGKLREPMIRFIQWGRTFGFKSAAESWKLPETSSTSARLGQSPLRAPSVFNFFRPGFVPPNTEFARTRSVAPEFQITNETTVASYINYMQGQIRNGTSVVEPTRPEFVSPGTPVRDIVASYTDEMAIVTDAAALMQHVNTVLCAGRISADNLALMVNALEGVPVYASSPETVKLDRIASAVLMAMASTDYIVQR